MGAFWPINQGHSLLGRAGNPGLSVALDDPTISAHHARVLASARPGRIKLVDLGSTNGTFVQNIRLEPGQPRELVDGELIQLGGLTMVVKII
jgi:pSer/pThr/pTyr-binding forkhead associated (FHA) protein